MYPLSSKTLMNFRFNRENQKPFFSREWLPKLNQTILKNS